MLGDKKFWEKFFYVFLGCMIFLLMGSGFVWLIIGFVETMIIGFAWCKILIYGIAILVIAIIAFFMVRAEYRAEKRDYYERKHLNLVRHRNEELAILFDECSSDEARDFASANAEMYLNEIEKAKKEYQKYGGKLW